MEHTLTSDEREALSRVKEHAESYPFNQDDLRDIKNNIAPAAGDREGFSFIASSVFKFTYSIEEQPQGKSRHLSITPLLPHVDIVEEAAKALGFIGGLEDCQLYFQEEVINIVELIK